MLPISVLDGHLSSSVDVDMSYTVVIYLLLHHKITQLLGRH